MSDESKILMINDWTVRVRIPTGIGPYPVVVLLHGWTGDENSMWIFASRFPKGYMLIMPRGLYPVPVDGFGWHPLLSEDSPQVKDFQESVEKLAGILNPDHFPDGDFSCIHLAGFSQGAALAYTFALLHPQRVSTLAGLSGFLPGGVDSLVDKHPLVGKKAFIAHGARDNLVPVDKARQAAKTLELAGAQVTYCEDNVGHKLSLNCFRALERFYTSLHC